MTDVQLHVRLHAGTMQVPCEDDGLGCEHARAVAAARTCEVQLHVDRQVREFVYMACACVGD